MQRIAIIGAGASGLTSAEAALEEGMLPSIFEASHRIGGVWGPDNREASDHGSAWPGMKVDISRHTGTFSHFQWPQNATDFPGMKLQNILLTSWCFRFLPS
jgi:dimethylaniline monooxygenase (N-oxide forming)